MAWWTPLTTDGSGDTTAAVASAAVDVLTLLMWALAGAVVGLLVSLIVTGASAVVRRRHPAFAHMAKRARAAQRAFFLLAGAGAALAIATTPQFQSGEEITWRPLLLRGILIVMVIATAALLVAVLKGTEDTVLARFKDSAGTSHAKRVRTQMQVVRRVGTAIIVACAIAGVLLVFPEFRAIGTTIFASAGVISVVAGLAAQSSLGNLFAGLQIVFTDSIRVDDVVVVDSQNGNIEELTLTYVVVRLWDDRRMILPCTYFTTTPFENWTRRESHMLGTVLIDVDWLTPIPALRVELQRIVEESDLWDGRTCGLQVTEAQGGFITVRAIVSAANSGQLWDLRCHVREQLVAWVRESAPYALPRTRLEPETTAAPPLQERQEFVKQMEADFESRREEQSLAEETVAEAETETARAEREAAARRARKEARRADARAARQHPTRLAGHHAVRPLPSDDSTSILSPEEIAHADSADRLTVTAAPAPIEPERTSLLDPGRVSRSADSHLYSGSPAAEERAQRLSGPPPEEMAEREDTASRRRIDGSASAARTAGSSTDDVTGHPTTPEEER